MVTIFTSDAITSYPIDYQYYHFCRTIRNELFKMRDKVDSGVVDGEVLGALRGLGVHGLEGDVAQGGEGLCMTEVMRVLEEFSVSMALSEAVTVANTIAVAPLAR